MSYGLHADKKEFRIPDGKGGGKSIFIRKDVLQRVQSRVKTHEGEILQDRKGREYMDKFSKEKLGKDLSGMYKKDL
jgi:hypothetical protein